ncbi:hypothetical protein V6N11_051903 [Hibiscus sabdariffa]|uniref:Uncharacterized protein n=1 Tax=Hibiscus sabdariffa TaxID=183260 RepID=A0ABR2U8I6_9ROSI
MLLRIAVIKGPCATILKDEFGWVDTHRYQFSLHEAYIVYARLAFGSYDIVWSTSRQYLGLQRTRRKFTTYSNYPLCQRELEDVNHLLCLYPSALVVWMPLIRPDCFKEFCAMEIHE